MKKTKCIRIKYICTLSLSTRDMVNLNEKCFSIFTYKRHLCQRVTTKGGKCEVNQCLKEESRSLSTKIFLQDSMHKIFYERVCTKYQYSTKQNAQNILQESMNKIFYESMHKILVFYKIECTKYSTREYTQNILQESMHKIFYERVCTKYRYSTK